jgi:phage shock protein C
MEPKRFYRSTTDKKIAGVAGGLGEYFDLDPLLVRLIFVVLAFAGGGGVLIYFILWIITPEKPFSVNPPQYSTSQDNTSSNPSGNSTYSTPSSDPAPSSEPTPGAREPKHRGSLIGGLVLITIGTIFLVDELVPGISFGDLWPVILVVIGIGLLFNSMNKR